MSVIIIFKLNNQESFLYSMFVAASSYFLNVYDNNRHAIETGKYHFQYDFLISANLFKWNDLKS